MTGTAPDREVAPLSLRERLVAGAAGAVLLGVGLGIAVIPPDRRVALGQCPNAAAGCVVSVDGDLTAFATVLAALGAVAVLLALLGVRFNRVKVAGTELGFDQATAGYAQAAPAAKPEPEAPVPLVVLDKAQDVPVTVDVQRVGERLGAVPVAVTRLREPISQVDSSFLRDYQSARKVSQRSYFLTHILGPATQERQIYSVAIRVTPHRNPASQITAATFYLGKAWGNRTFMGSAGQDGRFGITTEAYGPFLALCEVKFDDGTRLLLDHYCDFDMGSLLRP